MNTTQIQSGVSGSVDLFTGIFYVIRIFGLGQGDIKPSETASPSGGYYLEQDIFLDGLCPDALWTFTESNNRGFYKWKSATDPKSIVTYTYDGVDQADEESSYSTPFLELANEKDQDAPEDSLWEFESEDVEQYGYAGMAYKLKNKNLGQGVTTFSEGQKSPNGFWLQVDLDDPSTYKTDPRWTADSLFVFTPTNFKLLGETSHLKIQDHPDTSRIHQSRTYLVMNQTLQNPLPDSLFVNLTKETSVDYELYTQLEPGCDILSSLLVHSPHTVPSSKYFDLESEAEGHKYDGITDLVAKGWVKGREEFEVEAFSRKNISAFVAYLAEFRGLGFYSWTQVTAVANMMGENGEVVPNVPVKDGPLLKHLIRSRGYSGPIEEIDGAEGIARVQIRLEGVIRGSLPIPLIQFEEGPSVHVPQFELAYKARNTMRAQHLS